MSKNSIHEYTKEHIQIKVPLHPYCTLQKLYACWLGDNPVGLKTLVLSLLLLGTTPYPGIQKADQAVHKSKWKTWTINLAEMYFIIKFIHFFGYDSSKFYFCYCCSYCSFSWLATKDKCFYHLTLFLLLILIQNNFQQLNSWLPTTRLTFWWTIKFSEPTSKKCNKTVRRICSEARDSCGGFCFS